VDVRLVWKFGLAVLAVSAILSACGASSPPQARLPFTDDFSSPRCGWPTRRDASASLSCARGAYKVLIERSGMAQNIRTFLKTKDVERLTVEADVAERVGRPDASYGVTCWASHNEGFGFAVSPTGAWLILELNLKADPEISVLAKSSSATAIVGLRKKSRIRGDCLLSGSDFTAKLALTVNGRRIAVARAPGNVFEFVGFGLFVAPTRRATDVRFDNVTARKAPLEANCTSAGIRYVSAPDPDTAVCLTLSSDGRSLLEIGFYLPMILCPGNASPLVSMSLQGVNVGAHGRIARDVEFFDSRGKEYAAYLFRGRVNGATASGVISDKGDCEPFKVRWTAHRVR
jgi:hypothetical protein